MKTISHYCQKCRAANVVGERNCRLCGTRLMLVVFPPAIRHDEGIVPSYYEDHLLERVSLLELQLAQAVEKIGMAYEFLAREAEALKKDHKFIRAFSEALKEINPQLAEELSRKHKEVFGSTSERVEVVDKQKQFLDAVFSQHDKPNAELFKHLLIEGIKLLGESEEKQAFQMLERAALLSPDNVPLLVFIAENLYRADKFEESKIYLERAFVFAPIDEKILLLLGAIYADTGETDKAKKLLSILANNEKTTVVIHFIWGMMAAFEENWTESLAAFKQALGNLEIPELNYLIGCVYFQLQRFDLALQFLQKATKIDSKYSDALLMENLAFKIQSDSESKKIVLEDAGENRNADRQFPEYPENNNIADAKIESPFSHFKQMKKGLLTGGKPRMAKFFRERIYKAIENNDK